MAIKALNPAAPFWYTPKAEQDVTEPTRFQLRGMNGMEQAQVAPHLRGGADGSIVTDGEGMILMLGFCLVGWENFNDAKGPVKFSRNHAENQRRVPYELQTELAAEILNASMPDEDAIKN